MSYAPTVAEAFMKQWVGWHEGANNWNPFSFWQYGAYNNPWCGSFADNAACGAGGFRWPAYAQCGWKGHAYVPFIVIDAKRMGIFRPPSVRARKGWQGIYDWNHDGNYDHVETVVQDDGNRFITIGGNTNDSVLYRTRDRTYLVGFAALDEAGQGSTEPMPPPVYLPAFSSLGAALTTVAFPAEQRPGARAPSARPIPNFGNGFVLLENGASIRNDHVSGKNRVWRPPTVQAGAKLLDIAPTVHPKGHPQQGQPDGLGIVAFFDFRGEIETYTGVRS